MAEQQDSRPFNVPFWQLGVAIAAVVLALVVVIWLTSGDDDAETVAGGPSTTSAGDPVTPSNPIGFEAPPAQEESTTTTVPTTSTTPAEPTTTTTSAAPTTTAPPATSSTEAPSSTSTSSSSSTTTTTPTSTTTAPPRQAEPGPTIETMQGDHGELQAALAVARAQWAADQHPNGYVYRTRLVCFCPYGDNEIVVGADGEVEDQDNIEGETEHAPESITDLFDRLEEAAQQDAAVIRASFDTQSGYPVEFYIDYDELIADEEIGREIDWVASRP